MSRNFSNFPIKFTSFKDRLFLMNVSTHASYKLNYLHINEEMMFNMISDAKYESRLKLKRQCILIYIVRLSVTFSEVPVSAFQKSDTQLIELVNLNDVIYSNRVIISWRETDDNFEKYHKSLSRYCVYKLKLRIKFILSDNNDLSSYN